VPCTFIRAVHANELVSPVFIVDTHTHAPRQVWLSSFFQFAKSTQRRVARPFQAGSRSDKMIHHRRAF
jgi:hypothetical protein